MLFEGQFHNLSVSTRFFVKKREYLRVLHNYLIFKWFSLQIGTKCHELRQIFSIMHICYIKRYWITSVIDMEVNYVQSFVVNDLSPNINGCSCNIALYFVYNHVLEWYFAIQSSIFNPVYAIWLLIEINFIILKVKRRSNFERKAFSVFCEVLDIHVESFCMVNLLL